MVKHQIELLTYYYNNLGDKMKFGLIGDGKIAKYHKEIIKNDLDRIYDPKYGNQDLTNAFFKDLDYVVICSPSFLHYSQIKMALHNNCKVIVEKPMVLPWQPFIDDDRINIVLQLRYLDLPKIARTVKITMIRNEEYFQSWKGDPKNTGGVFFNLFIHYIDLAIHLNAEFIGEIRTEGTQERWVDDINILDINMQSMYDHLYTNILNGRGIKPNELYYLNYVMNMNSTIYGLGRNTLNKQIIIPKQLL